MALAKLLPDIGGPIHCWRLLLARVVTTGSNAWLGDFLNDPPYDGESGECDVSLPKVSNGEAEAKPNVGQQHEPAELSSGDAEVKEELAYGFLSIVKILAELLKQQRARKAERRRRMSP